MYIDKLIKKEVITLLISVAFLVVVFIGVTFAKFLSVDKGKKTVINMGDLNISFCNNSTCDTTYSNIGQVIGTKVENGVTVPASIYPFKNDGTYSNETPYIFKVENTGTLDSTVKIKLKEDATYTPTGDYSSYTRLSLKYPEHLKVAIRKRVLYQDTGYQLGDVNMDGIVDYKDVDLLSRYLAGHSDVELSDFQKKLSDLNSDSKLSSIDGAILNRLVAGWKNISADIELFYIYSYADLEDGVIFKDDIIGAGDSATYFLWLYLDESTPNDVQNTFFVGNIDVEGEFIPENVLPCKTNKTLVNNLKYVNGLYTYTYREKTDDWKVVLTDKTSTDPITVSGDVCTYINDKPITSMNSMYENSQAISINLSKLNTSQVTDMSDMFRNSKATTIDVSNFDTSNVANMWWMFSESQVTELDLSKFDTSKVTNMFGIFYSSQVAVIDVSSFDTSKVTDMCEMFDYSQATTIKGLEKFDTSSVTDMCYMFSNSEVTTLDLSSFDTSQVTNMESMFENITNLKTIYASDKFKTDNVTSSDNMFLDDTNLVGGAGTVYNANNVNVTYAKIDGGTSSPGYFTDVKNKPSTFAEDSWTTIASSVKAGNTRGYKVGETKTIDMGTYGTHTLRIANTSTPNECSTSGFSQTACGFVLEFADIITTHKMNNSNPNKGGWPVTRMRTFVNNDIYNAIPSELRNVIIDTTVVSGHGRNDTENFTSTDKLYLLSPAEIWAQGTSNTVNYDTARDVTRQLDYYKNLGTSTSNYSGAIKKNGTDADFWWLRSAHSDYGNAFFNVRSNGECGSDYSYDTYGVSPAFRLG